MIGSTDAQGLKFYNIKNEKTNRAPPKRMLVLTVSASDVFGKLRGTDKCVSMRLNEICSSRITNIFSMLDMISLGLDMGFLHTAES